MHRDRVLRALSLVSLSIVALALLAVPAEARAWGPIAHIGFSAQALSALPAVQPSARALLEEFANEFLYGSLAADIVFGKNLARYLYHCHNWRVGFNVYRAAKPGAEQAFALGFLAHLAADTVAHNYYVPYKTVASFHKARTGHAYWELRYDQRMDAGLVLIARRASGRAYRGHDDLLQRTLPGASVLPFGFSKRLFGSVLASVGARRFQGFSRFALAPERDLPLEPDLVEETRRLSLEAVLGLLNERERCAAARADATGTRNIRMACDLRKKLASRSKRLSLSDAQALAFETRETFRRSIQGKLVFPASLEWLVA